MWLGSAAEADHRSLNELIRQWAEDYRDFFKLPENMREVLEKDAKEMGKDLRGYLIHLMGLRFQELIERRGKKR
jgi:hypothetical protein